MAGREAIERKLTTVSQRLMAARDELAVAEAEMAHFSDVAADADLRAVVSDSALDRAERRDADRSEAVARETYERLTAEVARLEKAQDDLLDQLNELP